VSAAQRWSLTGEGASFALSGPLDFDSVPQVLGQSARLFAGSGDIELDLAEAGPCNSAAMALLIEWRGEAHRRGRRLRIVNLPKGLRALAQVCEAEPLLED
jgi:phospholipid transport system transporter-binding protein